MPSNQNSMMGSNNDQTSSDQGKQAARRPNAGQFKKGDQRTRDAGRKGGSVSSSSRAV